MDTRFTPIVYTVNGELLATRTVTVVALNPDVYNFAKVLYQQGFLDPTRKMQSIKTVFDLAAALGHTFGLKETKEAIDAIFG